MRTPKNQKMTKLYTAGNELIYKGSNVFYKGYYHSINGILYAGENENSFKTKKILIHFS